MRVWSISDLHLSHARPERRERYAGRWRDHVERIETQWREVVGPDDLVLLPGDLSMARTHREVQPDLAWLDRLPGTKVLSPGNHDRWWNRVEAIRPMLRKSELAVEGDAVQVRGLVVCGARGIPPESSEPSPQPPDREIAQLGKALADAAQLRGQGGPLFVLWHYPPFDVHGLPGHAVELIANARATACLYGHLHTERQWSTAVQGDVRGVRYCCVAADAIGFRPLCVWEGDWGQSEKHAGELPV